MAYLPPHKRQQSEFTPQMTLQQRLNQQSTDKFNYNKVSIPKFKGSFNDPNNKLDKLLENSIKKNPVGIHPTNAKPIYDNMYYNQYQEFNTEQKKIFERNYKLLKDTGVFNQYKNVDQLLSTFIEGRTLPVKNYNDLQLDTRPAPLTLKYSYPPSKIITGMIARKLNNPFIKIFSTRIYRFETMTDMINRGELTFSSFKNTNESEILQDIINSRYEKGSNKKYPFLNELCYRLYDKFLNINDVGELFSRINNLKRPFSVNYASDVLWDLTYTIINFNIEKKIVSNPYTNATGCGINTFYLFELITKQQALSISIEHFEKYGVYGSPLSELSKYFTPTSNIINIPMVGDLKINQLREFFTELAKSLPERNYTFIKLIHRLDNIDSGHLVGIIKLNTILYIIDISIGFISYINNDILTYYTMLYDGIQIMSTDDISSDQYDIFDDIIQKEKQKYVQLDQILEHKNIEGACKEQLISIHSLSSDKINSDYIESEYQKLNDEERLKYAIQYLNLISDKRQQQINDVRLKLNQQASVGGRKTKKKFQKNLKIKFQKKSKKNLKKISKKNKIYLVNKIKKKEDK